MKNGEASSFFEKNEMITIFFVPFKFLNHSAYESLYRPIYHSIYFKYVYIFLSPLTDFLVHLEPSTAAATQANREEVDSRSVFVGNVSLLSLFSLSFSVHCAICFKFGLVSINMV